MKKNLGRRGFSLVELVISMGLLIFLFASGFVVVRSLFVSTTSSEKNTKTLEKLNTTVAQLKMLSASDFDNMTETNFDRTGLRDRMIQIDSTIFPIDPATRTRRVELVATYTERGNKVHTKTLSFSLAQSNAMSLGAAVKGKFIDSSGGAPVAQIDVNIFGQDSPLLTTVSNNTGEFILYGVKTLEPSLTLNADASLIAGFFAPPVIASPLQQAQIPAANINPNEIRDLGNIVVHVGGTVAFTITDVDTGLPAPGVVVKVFPQPNSVPAGANLYGAGPVPPDLTSNINGVVTTNQMIPGQYYMLVIGNPSYAALDRVNSNTVPGNRAPLCTITEGPAPSPNCQNRTVQLKGAWSGQITEATGDGTGSNYVLNLGAPAGSGVGITFEANESFVHSLSLTSPYTSLATYNMNGTLAKPFVTTGFSNVTALTVPGGTYSVPPTTPVTINSALTPFGTVGAFAAQGNQVNPFPGIYSPGVNSHTMKFPYAPILVGNFSGTTKMFVYADQTNARVMPQGSLIDTFKFFAHAGGPAVYGNAAKNFSVLKVDNNTTARAWGKITAPAGPPHAFPAETFTPNSNYSYKFVKAAWGWSGSSSLGGLKKVVIGGVDHVQFAPVANYVTTVAADPLVPGTFMHTYNTQLTFGGVDYNALIPHLNGTDTQLLEFSASVNSPGVSAPFDVPVIAWTKDASGNAVVINPFNVSFPGLNFVVSKNSGGGGVSPVTFSNITVNNGNATFTHNNVSQTQTWSGTVGGVAQNFKVGETKNIDQAIPTSGLVWSQYFVKAVGPTVSGVTQYDTYQGYPNLAGALFQNNAGTFSPAIANQVPVVGVRNPVTFSGYVYQNGTTNGIASALVKICVTLFPANNCPTTTTNGSGFFTLTQMVSFFPGPNAWVDQVSAANFLTDPNNYPITVTGPSLPLTTPPTNVTLPPIIRTLIPVLPSGGGGGGGGTG